MTPIEAVQSAQRASLVDEDGECVTISLQPGLSPDRIETLEREAGVTLPAELKTLLAFSSGIEGGALDWIDFTGAGGSVGAEDILPGQFTRSAPLGMAKPMALPSGMMPTA